VPSAPDSDVQLQPLLTREEYGPNMFFHDEDAQPVSGECGRIFLGFGALVGCTTVHVIEGHLGSEGYADGGRVEVLVSANALFRRLDTHAPARVRFGACIR